MLTIMFLLDIQRVVNRCALSVEAVWINELIVILYVLVRVGFGAVDGAKDSMIMERNWRDIVLVIILMVKFMVSLMVGMELLFNIRMVHMVLYGNVLLNNRFEMMRYFVVIHALGLVELLNMMLNDRLSYMIGGL